MGTANQSETCQGCVEGAEQLPGAWWAHGGCTEQLLGVQRVTEQLPGGRGGTEGHKVATRCVEGCRAGCTESA